MTEGKRQKQVAIEIAKELNDIFLKMSLTMQNGGMISISSSFFQVKDAEAVLEKFKEHGSEIRGALGRRMRHQLRSIPQLNFYMDDTLDYVFKMEKLLDEIKKDSPLTPEEGKENLPD